MWRAKKFECSSGSLACNGVWLDRQNAHPWPGETLKALALDNSQRLVILGFCKKRSTFWKPAGCSQVQELALRLSAALQTYLQPGQVVASINTWPNWPSKMKATESYHPSHHQNVWADHPKWKQQSHNRSPKCPNWSPNRFTPFADHQEGSKRIKPVNLKVGVLLPNCPEYAVVVLGVSLFSCFCRYCCRCCIFLFHT